MAAKSSPNELSAIAGLINMQTTFSKRFAFRTVLAFLVLAAAVAMFFSSIHWRNRSEIEACKRIREAGGEVTVTTSGFLPQVFGSHATAVSFQYLHCSGSDNESYNPIDDLAYLQHIQSLKVNLFVATDEELNGLEAVSKNLRELSVSASGLTDITLSKVLRFPHLKSLSLGHLPVSRSSINKLGSMTALRELEISSISISDDELLGFGKLTKLRSLGLESTSIDGSGLKSLESLSNLETLTISTAEGEFFDHGWFQGVPGIAQDENPILKSPIKLDRLPRLPRLQALAISGCELDLQGLAGLLRQPSLVRLMLANSNFIDKASLAVPSNWRLRVLRIYKCRETKNLIPFMQNCKELETLAICDPTLTFADLERLSELPQLKTIVLSEVINDGRVSSICDFPKLETLVLNGIELSAADLKAVLNVKTHEINNHSQSLWFL